MATGDVVAAGAAQVIAGTLLAPPVADLEAVLFRGIYPGVSASGVRLDFITPTWAAWLLTGLAAAAVLVVTFLVYVAALRVAERR